jgi:GNAT superfamily N-acetyltransferase
MTETLEMSGVSVREFEPSDYTALAHIHDSLFPSHPFFLRRAKYEDSCYGQTRCRMGRFVAENASGMVIGLGEYKHRFFSYHPRKFAVEIEVHPDWQRHGVGRMLYRRVIEELEKIKAQAAWPIVLWTSTSGIEFLRKRRFVEKRRTIESRLDLQTFDSRSKSLELEKKLRANEILITPLSSEMRADRSAGSKLMELEASAAGDVPNLVEDLPMSFDDYEMIILNNPVMLWEDSFLAKQRELWVGLSSVAEFGISGVVEHGFTAVRPGFRGRGIAQVLKHHVAMQAKNQGATYIITHNDSDNASILSINRKIGFVKQAEWITFEKQL